MGRARLAPKGQDTPQKKLLRLVKKHFDNRFGPPAPPGITIEAMRPRLERWPVQRLGELWRGHNKTEVGGDPGLPVIVLRLLDLECLLDGAHRINSMAAGQCTGTHPIILLEAQIEAGIGHIGVDGRSPERCTPAACLW